MSNSFGFGGTNASLLMKSGTEEQLTANAKSVNAPQQKTGESRAFFCFEREACC